MLAVKIVLWQLLKNDLLIFESFSQVASVSRFSLSPYEKTEVSRC